MSSTPKYGPGNPGWDEQTERIHENLQGLSMEEALRDHLFGLDDPFEDRDPFEFL